MANPPEMLLSPYRPQKTTWLWRRNKAKQNPDVAQFGKLKIPFLMYRMGFLMYRDYLIQTLRAGSVRVPRSAGKCPLLLFPQVGLR